MKAQLEAEIISLRRDLLRMNARQQRMDDSLVKCIQAWQPLLLALGEAVLTGFHKEVKSSLRRRVKGSLERARELLPSISEPSS